MPTCKSVRFCRGDDATSELLAWAITQTVLTRFIWPWLRDWQQADDPRMRPTPLLLGMAKALVLGSLVFEWVGVALELVW